MNFELISLLADGDFHSGVELGDRLGITRAAVWKNIARLEQYGLRPESVKGVGYRLAEPLSLLSASTITELLSDWSRKKIEKLIVLPSLNSTNDFIKSNLIARYGYTLCLAEHQTFGRGRRGKQWVSPYGKNLYLSLGLKFEKGFEELNGLSLVVGIAVANSIAGLELKARLKWPNDVWINYKKLAGILVEVDGEQGGPLNLVIGIGVNINIRANEISVDQPWTSLAEEVGTLIDRNTFATSLIDELLATIEQFRHEGFAASAEEWAKYDGLIGCRVRLTGSEKSEKEVAQGICRGVDSRGYLLLESDGETHAYSGGELSLRYEV